MADPEVLDAEMQQVEEAFGLAREQVRRDHLISHVLGAGGMRGRTASAGADRHYVAISSTRRAFIHG